MKQDLWGTPHNWEPKNSSSVLRERKRKLRESERNLELAQMQYEKSKERARISSKWSNRSLLFMCFVVLFSFLCVMTGLQLFLYIAVVLLVAEFYCLFRHIKDTRNVV